MKVTCYGSRGSHPESMTIRTPHQNFGGSGGIRTPGGLVPALVFKTSAFDHSTTLPKRMERDSNPRWSSPHTDFRNQRLNHSATHP